MIFSKTFLSVIDNSGVKYVKCLKVIKSTSSNGKIIVAKQGDIVLCSVKFLKPLEKIKKGDLFRCLIVRLNSSVKRMYGRAKFFENSVIILNNKMEPLGNRIFGPIIRESIENNFVKLSSVRFVDI